MLTRHPRLTLLGLLLAFSGQAPAAELQAPNLNVLAWPRMSSGELGCYLEQTLGHRDPRFNCALSHYQAPTDPCHDTDRYDEGPAFPPRLASRVHPLATDVELTWEHGQLQQLTLTLKGTLDAAQVRRAFGLPDTEGSATPEDGLPENIMSAQIESSPASLPGEGSQGSTSITLTGFEHMGAGDVECDAEP